MTVETHPDATIEVKRKAELLHEYAVNDLGYHTDEVLFIAFPDGTIDGEIGAY